MGEGEDQLEIEEIHRLHYTIYSNSMLAMTFIP